VLVPSAERLHFVELVRQWSDEVVAFVADAGPLDAATARRLQARGIRIVTSPVTAVVGTAPSIDHVELADGSTVALDALFAGGPAEPHDGFLAHLGLARDETPFGSFLTVDGMGRTSAQRIWAAGNVVNPGATVPISIAAGAMVGGAINMALVGEDFERALSAEAAA
jgi:thioredoxin reductase